METDIGICREIGESKGYDMVDSLAGWLLNSAVQILHSVFVICFYPRLTTRDRP
jgi:hypothetical protein